jgi:hypothetical protein
MAETKRMIDDVHLRQTHRLTKPAEADTSSAAGTATRAAHHLAPGSFRSTYKHQVRRALLLPANCEPRSPYGLRSPL